MAIEPIRQGLPREVTSYLLGNETVYYFSFIAFKGGCGSSGKADKYWLAVTDKRVLYKTKVMEGKAYVEKDGILPFDKISFVEVSEGSAPNGCSSSKAFQLRISTSGGTVIIPIPTKQKGNEIRKIYSELSHR